MMKFSPSRRRSRSCCCSRSRSRSSCMIPLLMRFMWMLALGCFDMGFVYGKVGAKCKKTEDCILDLYPRELCHNQKCYKRCRVQQNCSDLKGTVCARTRDRGKQKWSKSERVCCSKKDTYKGPNTGDRICGLKSVGTKCTTNEMCQTGFCASDGTCRKSGGGGGGGSGNSITCPGTDTTFLSELMAGEYYGPTSVTPDVIVLSDLSVQAGGQTYQIVISPAETSGNPQCYAKFSDQDGQVLAQFVTIVSKDRFTYTVPLAASGTFEAIRDASDPNRFLVTPPPENTDGSSQSCDPLLPC